MSSKTKQVAKTTENTEATVPATFQLSKLCNSMDRNPKAVRARFRKLYNQDGTPKDPKSGLPNTVQGASRWTFATKDRERIVAEVNRTGEGEDGEE
jgi:hypothetical protein